MRSCDEKENESPLKSALKNEEIKIESSVNSTYATKENEYNQRIS